ncbi:MAG: biotin--[acetyl-CoA-carboxylase] ligase [bacterium]|nr:biotin--[acetyl-CoA-carboxylase] ligase [bacterium]
MSVGKLQVERIISASQTRRVGTHIEHHETLDSTNRIAWDRVADAAAGDGLVILAEHQSDGRGRLGRSWESPRGASVLMSLVLVDSSAALGGDVLALLAAVAAVDAIRAATGVVAEIKWPNDLLVGGRKLGGVLIESRRLNAETAPLDGAALGSSSSTRGDAAFDGDARPTARGYSTAGGGDSPIRADIGVYVVGLGINCLQHRNHFPEELRESATSLELESPNPVDRSLVVRHLVVELDQWLADPSAWDLRTLHDAWLRRGPPLGKRVRLRQAGVKFTGQIIDIDPAAGLVVQLDEGGRRLFDAATTSVLD